MTAPIERGAAEGRRGMSAQTTYEPRTVEQVACYVDGVGRAYCAACYHAGTERRCERSRDCHGACDLCHTPLTQSIELVDGWALIEYPPCKIF